MADNNMIDYLQSMRVRPPLTPAFGYQKKIGDDGILYQLESRNDTTKYKLDKHTQLIVPQPYKHYTKMTNDATDMFFPRKDPSIPPQRRKAQTQITNTRPTSTGRVVRGLSVNLQIDQDRFIERRRSLDEKELAAKMKQEDYEIYQRQRNQRASYSSRKEFLDLSRRNNEWVDDKENRIRQKTKELNDKKEQEIKQYKQSLSDHINKPKAVTDHRTWKDIEFEENQKRLERLHRRKEEMKLRSHSPFSVESRTGSRTARSTSTSLGRNNSMLDTATKRRKSDFGLNVLHMVSTVSIGSTISAGTGNKPSKSMTPEQFSRYLEDSKLRAIQRKYEREEKALFRDQEKKERSIMLEKQKYDNIFHAPLPYGADRMTKATQDRDKQVREKLEKKKHEEFKQQRKDEQRRLKIKEISAVLRTVIALNEDDRKSKHGGYIELSRSDGVTNERARYGKESYLKALQKNKQKIEDVLENRPTLLHRYDEDVARLLAKKRAEEKIHLITQSVAASDSMAMAKTLQSQKKKVIKKSSNVSESKKTSTIKGTRSAANSAQYKKNDDDDDDMDDDELYGSLGVGIINKIKSNNINRNLQTGGGGGESKEALGSISGGNGSGSGIAKTYMVNSTNNYDDDAFESSDAVDDIAGKKGGKTANAAEFK